MNRPFRNLSLAASIVAVALAFTTTTAQAQKIFVVQGGRTTVTLSPAFLADLTALKITPTANFESQLYQNQIFFPITSGAINLQNAAGQMLHSGGITLTAGTKQVRLESFILSTLGEQGYITALVVVDGKFLGRINLFDVDFPTNLTLPLNPKSGDFFLSVILNLDPQGAAALNDAFGVKTFQDNLYMGYALSLAFVPLSADGQ
jgi:hypothetical protein